MAGVARTVASLAHTVSEPLPLPPGSSAEFTPRARSASLMGWMDGTEDQKCPSNFFILCEYIGNVYTYIYPCSKFVTKFVMGLKI